MIFKDFWKTLSHQDRLDFAARAGSSFSTLNQLAFGDRNVSDRLALAIERETCGMVSVDDVRPGLREAMEMAGYEKRTATRKAA